MELYEREQKIIELLIEKNDFNAAYEEIVNNEKKNSHNQLSEEILAKFIEVLKEHGINWDKYVEQVMKTLESYSKQEEKSLKMVEISNRNFKLGFFENESCLRILKFFQENKCLNEHIEKLAFLDEKIGMEYWNEKITKMPFYKANNEVKRLDRSDALYNLKFKLFRERIENLKKFFTNELKNDKVLSYITNYDKLLDILVFYRMNSELCISFGITKDNLKIEVLKILKEMIIKEGYYVVREKLQENSAYFDSFITVEEIDATTKEIKRKQLDSFLKNKEFSKAEEFLEKNKLWFSEKDFEDCAVAKKEQEVEKIIKRLEEYIDDINADINNNRSDDIINDKIERCFNLLENKKNLINKNYNEYKDRIINIKIKKKQIDLQKYLNNLQYSEALIFLNKNRDSFQEKYPQLIEEICERKDIKEHGIKYNIEYSEEQIEAIYHRDKTILLRARAGSGKTLVIASTIDYLLKYDGISPNEILAIAFNRAAVSEMNGRLQKKYANGDFNSGRTFHKLARDIIKHNGNILVDEKMEEEIFKIFRILHTNKKELKNLLFEYFRDDFDINEERFDGCRKQSEINIKKHYLYDTYESISGSTHKSIHEKWIADFLFEHGIEFIYEKTIAEFNGVLYRPDFYLVKDEKPIVLEFFGIDKDYSTVPEEWSKDYDTYYGETELKKAFFEKNTEKFDFIELYYRSGESKKDFIERLKEELLSLKIILKKLSVDDIYEKMLKKFEDRFRKRFQMFINKAQQNGHSSVDMKNKINAFNGNQKVKIFSEIANLVYEEYENQKKEKNKKDFHDIFKEAIQTIETNQGNILFGDKNEFNLQNLKYIFIDEFQDFSTIFYEFLTAILKYNGNVNLFCVGDDWQSINGFTGSQTKYFKNFEKYFAPLTSNKLKFLNLLNNYRSSRTIINVSNGFRIGDGPSVNGVIKSGGKFEIHKIDSIGARKHSNFYSPSYKKINGDNPYFSIGFNRYMGFCSDIIKDNLDENIKTVGILFRENQLLENFKSHFPKKINNLNVKVEYCTIHKAKGLEKDMIIIVDVCKNKFPRVHPDNKLNQIFGTTEDEVLEEEKNLFYVALTRAKHKLYIITEESRESIFLNDIRKFDNRSKYRCR